jgi:phosphate transport system substrate-binding protein
MKRFFNTPYLFFFISTCLYLYSCSSGTKDTAEETIPNTPTSGKLTVFCEEGISLELNNLAYTFGKLYKNATIKAISVNEKEAVEGLYNDSCKVIALSRSLSESELKKFQQHNLFIQSVFIAKTATALVVSRDCADSVATLAKLKALLSGDSLAFSTLSQLVFDNENSGATRFLKDSLLNGKMFGKNCHAAKTTPELIELISKNKHALGVMDYAWLSDKDDNTTKEILKKVKIIPLARQQGDLAYFPDQSNIQTGDYPLCRSIYLIRRGEDFSLGAGFISFVAGQKGQIMMLKAGLAPGRQPERVIEVNMH